MFSVNIDIFLSVYLKVHQCLSLEGTKNMSLVLSQAIPNISAHIGFAYKKSIALIKL